MEDLVLEFNRFFEGVASAEIVDGELHVTIGEQTLFIRLPEVVGGKSTAS